MALPNVVIYNLAASSITALVNAAASGTVNFTLATTILDTQRRVAFTTAGNESGNTFTIVGTNAAGNSITEAVTGPNASTTQSNLDFKTVSSITASTATVDTVSIGTNGNGSSLWNIMNWHVTPVNIEVGCILQQGAATFTLQYTYDDPNNLPSGVSYPQPFNHPSLANATASIDGAINDPVTGVRLLISGGTGTVRMNIIQAGIAGP